jgi:hypothetical protein
MDVEYVVRDAIVCPARFRFYQTCQSEDRSDEESAAPLRLGKK